MLPKRLRLWLFDAMSVQTMRYVTAVPRRKARGLVAEVYDMITDDFFINGSLTSRSRVPRLLAAMWTAGRETILVEDGLDRTTKEAMTAVLSGMNDCPYCGDMLVSLVHAGEEHGAAGRILARTEDEIEDPLLRERLAWVKAVAVSGRGEVPPTPFTEEQLPEAVGALMAMSDINRFSHVVMDGSPLQAPKGLEGLRKFALRIFGGELKGTQEAPVPPGRALRLLPDADLPEDLAWSESNPRVAAALARWATTVEEESRDVVPSSVRTLVERSLSEWNLEPVPLSRSWVEEEVADLAGRERAIAKLALVLGKASHQVDESLVDEVVGDEVDEEPFVRLLAWMTCTAARHFGRKVAEVAWRSLPARASAAG